MHIEKLRNRLQLPLPGVEAQMAMMPEAPDNSRFDLSNRKNAIPGGVLLLIYQHNGEYHIPMMLRPEYGGAHSGQVSFPGGKKEKEDIDLTFTALREAEEELGIQKDQVQILGNLTELFIIASNFVVFPVVAYSDKRPDFTPDPREVVEVIETPISNLLKKNTVKEESFKVGGGIQITAPYYDVNGHHVWGATAMMISEFLTIYREL